MAKPIFQPSVVGRSATLATASVTEVKSRLPNTSGARRSGLSNVLSMSMAVIGHSVGANLVFALLVSGWGEACLRPSSYRRNGQTQGLPLRLFLRAGFIRGIA